MEECIPDLLKSATRKRRIEFLRGRYCAQMAAEKLTGMKVSGIGINHDRSPQWPSGIVGSISHTGTFACAAVSNDYKLAGLGIDVEQKFEEEIVRQVEGEIVLPSEMRMYESFFKNDLEYREYVTLIFSAKESVFKCLHPLTGTFFGFSDASIISVDFAGRSFKFRLLKRLGCGYDHGFEYYGRFHVWKNHVFTSVELQK